MLNPNLSVAFLLKSSLLLSAVLFQTSCATGPKRFDSYQEGRWQAKTLIQDLKQNKSYVVYIDVNAIRPDRVRLDVETSLGIHVASLNYNRDKVQVIVPDQRKYYHGKASKKAFSKLIPLEVDPKWLSAILFDEDLKKYDWTCEYEKSGLAKKCETKGLTAEWLKREGGVRVVSLESKSAKIQMQLKNFRESAKQAEFYEIPKPTGFTSIKL